MSRVSVSRANSSRRPNSAEERARRETSSPKTAPTSPRHTRATSARKPARSAPNFPDRPRSASITSTSSRVQPSRTAWSARLYWRRVDSVFSRTCNKVDCRKYTIALRERCPTVTFSRPFISAALRPCCCLHHVGQRQNRSPAKSLVPEHGPSPPHRPRSGGCVPRPPPW